MQTSMHTTATTPTASRASVLPEVGAPASLVVVAVIGLLILAAGLAAMGFSRRL